MLRFFKFLLFKNKFSEVTDFFRRPHEGDYVHFCMIFEYNTGTSWKLLPSLLIERPPYTCPYPVQSIIITFLLHINQLTKRIWIALLAS